MLWGSHEAAAGCDVAGWPIALSVSALCCCLPTKGWIEALRDMRAERSLGRVGRPVHSATDESVDQRPDDFRPGHRLSAFPSYVGRQPIEMHDLPLEQHHGHLGPRLSMNAWPSSRRFRMWLGLRPPRPFCGHRFRPEIVAGLLPP